VGRLAGWAAAVLLAAAPSVTEADSGGHARAPLDLLALLDVEKDAVAGAWKWEGRALVTPARPFHRIQIPYAPPAEYDVTVVVERTGPSNSLNLGLVLDGRQFLVILDGFINGEFVSGLDLVDGKSFYANETTHRGVLVAEGKPVAVRCAIRKDRVRVTVDGKAAVDWKADPRRLSLYPSWAVPDKQAMLLGTWSSVVKIRRAELRPVSGSGRRRR
jgi:hypothetical protein